MAYIKDVLGPVGLDTAEGLGGANRLVCKPGLHGGSPRQASHRVDLIDSCLRMKEKKERNRNVLPRGMEHHVRGLRGDAVLRAVRLNARTLLTRAWYLVEQMKGFL